jgi:catechol 2,3-dioxygenase-like lactoylglutathione lyase family enzyme
MLGTRDVVATIAVRDLAAARRWYEEKLGLSRLSTEGEEAVTYRAGNSKLLVYRSQFAGTNKATAATWTFDGDLDAEVRALKDKGIRFEHYEFPDVRHEGDVHVMGDMRAAWFADPDGNILALVSARTSDMRS